MTDNNSQKRDRSFPSVQPECDRDVWDAQPANQPKENEDGRKAGMVDAAAGSLCGVALAEGEGAANVEGEEPIGMGRERVAAAKLIANYIEAYDANPSINYIRLNRKEAEQIAAALASPPRAIPAEQAAPTDERILHLWDTRVGDPTPARPLTDTDKLIFAHAVLAAHPHEASAEAARLVYALCEDIEDRRSTDTDFDRGMRTAAKRIRKEVLAAMGTPAAAEPGKGDAIRLLGEDGGKP